MTSIIASTRKLEELIVLVALRSENDPKFGAVKLNKLLFWIDFTAFRLLGKPVTGQEYFRLREGPAPRRMKPVMDGLVKKKAIAVQKVSDFGKGQDKTFSLRQPDVSLFRPDEVDLIHQVIQANWNKSGTEMSGETHRLDAWRLAKDREVIPYSVSLVGRRAPTASEIEYAKELEDEARELLGQAPA